MVEKKSMTLGKISPVIFPHTSGTVAFGVGMLVLARFVELDLGGGGRIL